MIPFLDDPATTLRPEGGVWVGVLIPALILAISIAVSFFLYWYFVRARAHEK